MWLGVGSGPRAPRGAFLMGLELVLVGRVFLPLLPNLRRGLTCARPLPSPYGRATSGGGGGNSFTSVAKTGNNLVLTWTTGTLEQADIVTGPYTAVPGATSPATSPISGAAKFLRLK